MRTTHNIYGYDEKTLSLHPGSGDGVYLYAFEQIIIPAAKKFKPELILVSAGQDANAFDPLARMMVSAEGYAKMTKMAKDLADEFASGRVVCLHEGGYCPVYVPYCTHYIIEALSDIKTDLDDPFILDMEATDYKKVLLHQKERIDKVKAIITSRLQLGIIARKEACNDS